MHQQGVVFIKERSIMGQVLHEKLLIVIIRIFHVEQTMPAENPFCIYIYDKNGLLQRIQQNAVRRLRTNAVKPQQLL